MSDRALIQALETRLVNAWPAFEIEVADGWLLRFAEGYSKRANAATPLMADSRLDDGLVEHILGAFEARGIDPCFRLTGMEASGADAALSERGFVAYDPSLCMTAAIEPDLDGDEAVEIEPVAKPDWIEAAARAYGGDKSNHDILGRIVRRIREPAAFATLNLDGQAAAWGFAVAERGFVGLYDIVVAPDLRGLGLGRRLVSSLMAWGREAGAARAYLQMRESNEVAGALYASLGFATAYRYTHRIPAPAKAATEPASSAVAARVPLTSTRPGPG